MDRAVPAIIRIAASSSAALRSFILILAILRSWSSVTLPTFSRLGTGEPDSRPSSFLSSSTAGGVLVMKLNVRSL